MSLSKISLLALCIVLLGAIATDGAYAQDKPDKPIDLKPLIPPVFSPRSSASVGLPSLILASLCQ